MEAIDWNDDFDPAYGIVYMLPSTYVYYRGYDSKYPVISERPAYFGSLEVANGYAKGPGRKVNAFTNTKMLKLIDVRFMKDILRNLFEQHDRADPRILSTILSFGICSLSHQIYLASLRLQTLKDHPSMINLTRYYKKGLYEQQGFRIAETSNDAETMGFLQALFSDFIDGFISPRQFSPFHVEKPHNIMNAEMILFNPKQSGITIVSSRVEKMTSVSMFYSKSLGRSIRVGNPTHPYNFYVGGGGYDDDDVQELPSVEQINARFDEPEIRDAWNRGVAAGKCWKDYARFGECINPVPTVAIQSWPRKATRDNYFDGLSGKN